MKNLLLQLSLRQMLNFGLITFEYCSLYIGAMETTFERRIFSNVINSILYLVLILSNFIFNCQNYLQIKGCSMGKKCAPSYENMFFGYTWKTIHISFGSKKVKTMSGIYRYFFDMDWNMRRTKKIPTRI